MTDIYVAVWFIIEANEKIKGWKIIINYWEIKFCNTYVDVNE